MDLKEYRELNRTYFHKDGFAIDPQSDKDRESDEAILNCIIRENPDIGRVIVGFTLQDRYFLWHSIYPSVSEADIVKVSDRIRDYIDKSVQRDEDDSLPALEKMLRENRNKIDYRRLLLSAVESAQNAIEYAKRERAPQEAIAKIEARKADIVKHAKKFRPHVEDPEIYMVLPSSDPKRSLVDFHYISWDELIEGKKPRTSVDIGLSNQEQRDVERLFNLEDTRLIPTSWEFGKHVETCLAVGLEEADTNGNQIKTEDAYAIVKDVMRKPEYQRMIDPAKYHFLALYRALEFMESYVVADDETFKGIPEKADILVLSKKFIELIDQDYQQGRRIDEPFTVFIDDNRYESKYRYNAEMLLDTGAAGMIDKVTVSDLNNYYFGITREYMDRIIENDPMAAIDLYQKKVLTLPEFAEYIKEANEKNYVLLLNKAYDKKILNKNSIELIMKRVENRDEESLRKLGLAELQLIMQRVRSESYTDNAVLDEMLLSGVINQDLLIQQYFNGMLKEEDLTSFARYIENSEATKELDSSKIKFNPEALAQVYTQLNLKNILMGLANKEHYDKELVSEFMKERPYLIKNCTPEQLNKFKETYILQTKLLKKLDDGSQKEFMESLGLLAYAHGIAFDLYDKGIISKGIAETYGGTEFIKQYQKTILIDGLRYNDLASIKNLINAYNHGRITLSKVLRKYAEGEISPEIYFAFKENRDMTEAIDKAYLISLYDKYAKTGKKADLEVLETYYQEFKSIVKDEKDLEEINKKQLELINSKKNSKTNVVTMARSGVIDKGNIAMMDIETIAQLIMSGNTLNRDTARELFRDTDGTTTKRARLEELFKKGILTQDEMFTILSNVYVGNKESSPEQQEIDTDNMNYFFDQDYFESEYDEMVERTDPTRHNRKNVGTTRNEQQRYPIKERIEFLYSLDEKESVNYKAGPAIIIQLPGKNKVVIETLGTPGKNGAGTISDLTNHHTYIVSKNTFEDIKDEIFESKEATTRTHRKEIESVLMFRKLIDLYNERGKQIGMKRFRHNQYWASSLQKYFEEPKVKEQKEVKKENKDRDDD